MLVFLDTEFTDFAQPELISIGLATIGAPDFYAERSDYPIDRCSPFVVKEVLPLLGRTPESVCSALELSRRLNAWFDALPEQAHVLYDFEADWKLLNAAFVGELPNRVGKHELVDRKIFRHSAYKLGEVLTYTAERPPHHALADAQALLEGYLRWKAAMDGRTWSSHVRLYFGVGP